MMAGGTGGSNWRRSVARETMARGGKKRRGSGSDLMAYPWRRCIVVAGFHPGRRGGGSVHPPNDTMGARLWFGRCRAVCAAPGRPRHALGIGEALGGTCRGGRRVAGAWGAIWALSSLVALG